MSGKLHTIRRALISVADKTGIDDLARYLRSRNVTLISTGGTLRHLRSAGIDVTSVSDVTGFPEILDGRVKTLHPAIHAGILAVTELAEHRQQIEALKIEPIDMVVVNLYPFEETVANPGHTFGEAIEQIDIGGPAMLRAAAKNYRERVVVANPARYAGIMKEMDEHNGGVTEPTRYSLAMEVFSHTARYDTAIAEYLGRALREPGDSSLPETFSASLMKERQLRYGENPHQEAALYGNFHSYFQQLHGKELSYNNIVDIQAASELVEEFEEPAAVIIKHTNPCGAGSGAALAEAYARALSTDPKSAYGGIVAVNRPLDAATAAAIDAIFTEVVIAPSYADGVVESMMKKQNRRLIRATRPLRGNDRRLLVRSVAGGVLVQTPDRITVIHDKASVVTRRHPTENESAAMAFAWLVAKHVKSNAIVYARSGQTLGIGAGQMSRVDSSRIAVMKALDAGLDLRGCAVASDAFFPFADGLLEAVQAGATAVIQPGGSVRDEEVIRAADEHNITMIFTGIRHFQH